MLHRMTNDMVAMAWLCNISSVHHHMWTENGILYSYTTPIGVAFVHDETLHVILTTERYSHTTSRHMTAALVAANRWDGVEIHRAPAVMIYKDILMRQLVGDALRRAGLLAP